MKKILALLLTVCMLMSMVISMPGYAEGTGTEGDPILITSASELLAISGTNYYKLATNIELPEGFTPVKTFSGVLDGDGKSITVTNQTAAIITTIASGATVKNLKLYGNATFAAVSNGVLAGANAGTIFNVENNVSVYSEQQYSAGIVGVNSGLVEKCVNNAELTFNGGAGSGGIVGYLSGTGIVRYCANNGDIYATQNNNKGGIVGRAMEAGGLIECCYNTGDIDAPNSSYVGGIASNLAGEIKNCFNTGNITGSGNVGGITPYETGEVSYCYNAGMVNGYAVSPSPVGSYCLNGTTNHYYGATDLYEADMCKQESFASFDFDKVWGMNPNGQKFKYPQLQGMYFTVEYEKGTENNPYKIPADIAFSEIGNKAGVYYELSDDIELSGTYTIPEFAGVFDGKGHTITVTNGVNSLFTSATATAVIKNTIIDGNITFNANDSGAFVGILTGTIDGCVNLADITTTKARTGGVVGQAAGGAVVKNCGNRGNITFPNSGEVGGVIGYCGTSNLIENCFNTGNLLNGNEIGGIVGTIKGIAVANLSNCFNTGNITSAGEAGGIVGKFWYASGRTVNITNCYNAGIITKASVNVSGANAIIASVDGLNFTNCYYLAADDAGKEGTTALSADKMTDSENYALNFAGFDFENIWTFNQNENKFKYPQLKGLEFVDEIVYGTVENPYLIDSQEDFEAISTSETKLYYKLAENITITAHTPIAKFYGEFDGNGKTITIVDGTNGLFLEVCENAVVKNLTVAGNVTTSSANNAVFAGKNQGLIKDCYNYAEYTGTKNQNAVFVGANYGRIEGVINYADITLNASDSGAISGYNGGTIVNSGNMGDITIINSSGNTGGIAGQHYGASIDGCFNTGNIKPSAKGISPNKIGGIAGENRSQNITITNCFNTGDITVNNDKEVAGGIVGHITNKTGITFENCYNAGTITSGSADISAEAAIYYDTEATTAPTIKNCFYFGKGDGKDGSIGLSKEQMTDAKNYAENFIGFDFENKWTFNQDENAFKYPQLQYYTFVIEIEYGTKDYPYEIPNKVSFADIANDNDAYYILTENITLESPEAIAEFSGNFNGNGKSITIVNGKNPLFTTLINGGIIANVTLKGNVKLTAGNSAVLVGLNNQSTINNVKNYAELVCDTTEHNVGAISGENRGTITNSANYADIIFSSQTSGAIAGWNRGTILACANYGDIKQSSKVNNTGGIAGRIDTGVIEKSFNQGDIYSFGDRSGGIVGSAVNSNETSVLKITDCYNAGKVSSNNSGSYCAGIISYILTGAPMEITNCYNAGEINRGMYNENEISGIYNDAGNKLPVLTACYVMSEKEDVENGILPSEMSKEESFKGFDFENVWMFDGTSVYYTYPQLSVNVVPTDYEAPEAPALYGAYNDVINSFALNNVSTEIKFKLLDKDALLVYADLDKGNIGYKVKEFGFVLTLADETEVTVKADKLEVFGDYGTILYGEKIAEGTYTVKPYVIYAHGEEDYTVFGESGEFTTIKVRP